MPGYQLAFSVSPSRLQLDQRHWAHASARIRQLRLVSRPDPVARRPVKQVTRRNLQLVGVRSRVQHGGSGGVSMQRQQQLPGWS